jgi:hypothetical protein
MNRMFAAVAGLALVVVVGVIGLGLYVNRPGIGGVSSPLPSSPPSLMPTDSPTAVPTATAAPTATTAPSAKPSPSRTSETGSLPKGTFVVSEGDAVTPITITIPASGWSALPDFDAVQTGTEVANVPEAAILFWSYAPGTDFSVYGDPCHWTSTAPETPATNVNDFVAALAAQPSRDASEPVDTEVAGYTGKALTLHVPDDAVFAACDQGDFATWGFGSTATSVAERTQQGPGQIDDFVILDVNGATVVIDMMYRPDTSPQIVDAMRGIVESATFGN